MKTHIDIDEDVLSAVQEMGGFATKREAVHAALSDMARRLAARRLLAMRGTVEFEGDAPAAHEPHFHGSDAAR